MHCSEHVGGSLHYQPLRMHASLLPVFFFLAEYQLDPCMKRKGQPVNQVHACIYSWILCIYIYIYTGSLAYDGPSLEKEKNFGVSEWPKHRLLLTFKSGPINYLPTPGIIPYMGLLAK